MGIFQSTPVAFGKAVVVLKILSEYFESGSKEEKHQTNNEKLPIETETWVILSPFIIVIFKGDRSV